MVYFGLVVAPLGVIFRMLPILGLALLFTFGVIFQTATAQDPRTDPSGYRTWCENQGGTIYRYQGSLACRPRSGRPPRTGPRVAPRPDPAPPPDDGSALRQQREVGARHQREREEEQRAAREADADAKRKERQNKALMKAKEDALGLLKGVGYGTGGLKSSGGGDLKLKSGTSTFGIKGNPAQGLTLKTSTPSTETRMVTKRSRFSKGTKYSAPVVTDPGKVQSGTQRELKSANRKTELLLDALQAAKGSWEKALEYLRTSVRAAPNDTDARQALAYLRGLHKGYLSLKLQSDSHYRYGIRQWLENDFVGATKAFAQAVADNPSDKSAVASYGYAFGALMESPACRQASKCPKIDLPKRHSADVSVYRKQFARLKQRIKQNPDDLKTRLALEYLEGLLVYPESQSPDTALQGKPMDVIDIESIGRGLNLLQARDYIGAVGLFSKAHKKNQQVRDSYAYKNRLLFAHRYALGRWEARHGQSGLPKEDHRHDEVWKKTLVDWEKDHIDQTFEDLFDQLEDPIIDEFLDGIDLELNKVLSRLHDTERGNPFFGPLQKSKVARVKRRSLGR